MSVRQRVLHSAPLIAFALAIVFLGLSLGGLRPGRSAGPGRRAGQSAADQSVRPGRAPRWPTSCSRTLGWSSLAAARWASRSSTCSWSAAGRSPTSSGRRSASRWSWSSRPASIHKLAPTLMPSPPVGSGGYVGALVAIFLEVHFGPVGMRLILAAAGLFGLALCHDVVFLLAGPGDPRLAPAADWRRRPAVHAPSHPPGSTWRCASDAGDWEIPGGDPGRPRSRHRCRCTRRSR